MTVYARTERGHHVAYDPQSELPRKLKSILRVIDGKTTLNVYLEKLHAFGDVRGMLHSLHMTGLIEPLATGLQNTQPRNAIKAVGQLDSMQPPRTDEWYATRSTYASSTLQTTRESTGADRDTVASPRSTSLQTDIKSARALESATDLMATFVLLNIPEQSFQILKELEEVASLDMLAVLLGGYQQMVSHLGEPSAQHLTQIKQILRNHM